jgi:hypothetical protein
MEHVDISVRTCHAEETTSCDAIVSSMTIHPITCHFYCPETQMNYYCSSNNAENLCFQESQKTVFIR